MITHHSRAARAACIFVAAIAILVVGIQPVFIGLMAERLGLSLPQQGTLIAVEMCGSVIGTLLVPLFAARLGNRLACQSMAAALVLFNAAACLADALGPLLALRLLAGMASGALYAQAVFALGRMPGPDRSFGLLLLTQTLVFALMAAVVPQLAEHLGGGVALGVITGWFALAWWACGVLPRQLEVGEAVLSGPAACGSAAVGIAALLGMLCLQFSIYAVWGFVDGLAGEQGLDAAQVGWAVSLGLLGGLPGAGLPSLLGRRVGRLPMILVGSLCVALSVVLLARGVAHAAGLAGVVFLMNFGWVLALTYYMAAVVTHDPDGRLARLISVVQVSSAASAPTLLSLAMGSDGQGLIFTFSLVAVLFGGVLQLLARMAQRRPAGRFLAD